MQDSNNRSKLIVSIWGDATEIAHQLTLLEGMSYDLLELCPSSPFDLLALGKKIPHPWILNYKLISSQTDDDYSSLLQLLATLGPDIIDIDVIDLDAASQLPPHVFSEKQYILSHHDFGASYSPEDLECLYNKLCSRSFIPSYIKIALTPSSPANALALFRKAHQLHEKDQRLIFVCMGEKYSWTRILSSKWNMGATYCSLPGYERFGQISLHDLTNTYSFFQNNTLTSVYALLGDPVHHSLAHLSHNQIFRELNENALYCKIQVSQQEIGPFLEQAQKQFSGFCITMPLKKEIVHGEIINTIFEEHFHYSCANTDAISALTLLQENNIRFDQEIVILGKGATGEAIAKILQDEGWHDITILSRSCHSTEKYGGITISNYDQCTSLEDKIIINATPFFAEFPQEIVDKLFPCTLFFETNYSPPTTILMQKALQQGCPVIWGIELFALQASLQMDLWLHLTQEKTQEVRYRIIELCMPYLREKGLSLSTQELPRQIHQTTNSNKCKHTVK